MDAVLVVKSRDMELPLLLLLLLVANSHKTAGRAKGSDVDAGLVVYSRGTSVTDVAVPWLGIARNCEIRIFVASLDQDVSCERRERWRLEFSEPGDSGPHL